MAILISPISASRSQNAVPALSPTDRVTPIRPVTQQPGMTTPYFSATQEEAPSSGVILQLGNVPPQTGLYGSDGRLKNSGNIQSFRASTKTQNEPCTTCAERKYQDGSDDMGVSFQTPTKVAPEAAGALVRAHEQEHVSHANAEGHEKNMNVQSTVIIHTDICPECKRVYVAGGTTYTQMSSNTNLLLETV